MDQDVLYVVLLAVIIAVGNIVLQYIRECDYYNRTYKCHRIMYEDGRVTVYKGHHHSEHAVRPRISDNLVSSAPEGYNRYYDVVIKQGKVKRITHVKPIITGTLEYDPEDGASETTRYRIDDTYIHVPDSVNVPLYGEHAYIFHYSRDDKMIISGISTMSIVLLAV